MEKVAVSSRTLIVLFGTLSVFLCLVSAAAVDVRKLKTFSTAIKGHKFCPCHTCNASGCTGCPSTYHGSTHGCQATSQFESELYNFNASKSTSDNGGVIRLMWFTGELLWPNFGNTTIRVYVDGEAEPSIAFQLYESHALGFGWNQGSSKTWGNTNFGKEALFGGLYMTFEIPFSRTFLITAELPYADRVTHPQSRSLYFICRGLLNMPVLLDGGRIELPANARLRLLRTAITAPPKLRFPFASVEKQGGLVHLVTFRASSANPRFLEGEFHATLDGEEMSLSSGTEDYFLSAQYFDAGEFQLPLAGCNHLDLGCLTEGSCRVVAYRFHERDPVVWQSSMSLSWQVGDGHWPTDNTTVSFYTWVYVW